MASHFHPIKVASVRQETPDCISVQLDISEELQPLFSFEAGQHITIRQQVEGEEVRRNYSICSSPSEKDLRIAIKKMPYGIFSNWAATNLQAGTTLEVLPPMGKFVLPHSNLQAKQYLLIAAGSGITPVLSILKTILTTEPASCVTLVYGNRDRNNIIFKDELDGLKNRYMQRLMIHHIFSREKSDAPIFEGRIDADKCAAIFNKLIYLQQLDEVFICGPGAMIDTVRTYLEKQQFPKEKVHFELFTAGTQQQPHTTSAVVEDHDDTESATITIKQDGVQSSFRLGYHGASILDAALSYGADLPYACKSGVCCTCKGKLLKGKVYMDQNYGLEPDEMAAGYILTCQSHPTTEEVLVDFD